MNKFIISAILGSLLLGGCVSNAPVSPSNPLFESTLVQANAKLYSRSKIITNVALLAQKDPVKRKELATKLNKVSTDTLAFLDTPFNVEQIPAFIASVISSNASSTDDALLISSIIQSIAQEIQFELDIKFEIPDEDVANEIKVVKALGKSVANGVKDATAPFVQ